MSPGRSPLVGEHWQSLLELLPAYRALTRVEVGDGRMTSFWQDRWLPCGALIVAFPALFAFFALAVESLAIAAHFGGGEKRRSREERKGI